MAKLTKAGSGFIKYDDGLLNLKGFREVNKFDEMDASLITFTPFMPLKEDWENNVPGSWSIQYDTEEERDKDFELIEEVLKEE